MKISSILDIVDGSLLNSPSISFIYSIKTNVEKVKEGDLFIAKRIEDIPVAVKNGAFAILLKENHPIIDNEIAWIKVNDIDTSIIKIIRFNLAVKNLKAYYCEKPTYDLLKIYSNYLDNNIKLVPTKLENILKFVEEITDNDVIISSNKDIINKIYPNNSNFEEMNNIENINNLIEHSLFETTFSYKELYFSRLKLSSLYISNFIKVFAFINKEIDFSKLKSFLNLKSIFLDRNLNIIEFGKSDKFIICQKDLELIENEIIYIKNKYKYAKTLFITNNLLDFLKDDEQILIKNIEELKPILRKLKFNGVYIIGFNHKDVYDYLIKLEESQALF